MMDTLCETLVLGDQGGFQDSICLTDLVGVGLTVAYSCLLFGLALYVNRVGYRTRTSNVRKFTGHYCRYLLIIFLLILHIMELGESFVNLERRSVPIRCFLVPSVSLLAIVADLAFHFAIERKGLEKLIGLEIGYWIMATIWRIVRLILLTRFNLSWRVAVFSLAVLLCIVFILLLFGDAVTLFKELKLKKYTYNTTKCPPPEKRGEQTCYRHDSANAFSQITFWWLNPLLWRGYQDPIELEDLGSLPREECASEQFRKFYDIYNKELLCSKLHRKKSSLWKCFFRFVWPNYYWGGLHKLLGDCVGLVGPLGISVIIDYAAGEKSPTSPAEDQRFPTIGDVFTNGYMMGVVLFLAAIAQGTLSQCSTHLVNIEGIRLKSALQSLVYDKYMRMASWSSTDASISTSNEDNNLNTDPSAYTDTEEKQTKKNREDDGVDGNAITNLISEDAFNVMSFIWIGHYIWAIPLKIIVLMFLLYLKLGVSAIIGANVCIFIMTPLQFYIGKKMSSNSKTTAERSDERMTRINEVFQGIKILKMYGWETIYGNKILEARNKELELLNKESVYWALITFLTHASSVLITLVTFGLYFVLEEGEMTPANVFAGLALFNQLTVPLFIFPVTVPIVISALVSTRRLEEFFNLPEINNVCPYDATNFSSAENTHTTNSKQKGLFPNNAKGSPFTLDNIEETEEGESEDISKDNISDKDSSSGSVEDYQTTGSKNIFKLDNAVFVWGQGEESVSRINISQCLNIPKGKLTMVVGKTASGKSSFLSALIGEMNLIKGTMIRSSDQSLAYVSQSPWLMNSTIRENILFGRPMRARRYRRVLAACSLHADLAVHVARDQAPAGTLSGGQRQRVALARALYSHARVLVLDDPLAALDHTVAQKVFEKGIRRACEKDNRTIVMVTHRLQLLALADQIIYIDNGSVCSVGTLDEVEALQPALAGEWRALSARPGRSGLRERTARGRWQLLRLASRVTRQLREHQEQQEKDEGLIPSFIPLRKRFTAFQGSKYFTHDLLLPTDECDDEMLRNSVPKRSSTRRRKVQSLNKVGSRKHKTAERSSSLQVTKHKVKPAPMLRQSSTPTIQFDAVTEVDAVNSCSRHLDERTQQRYLLRNLFPLASHKLIDTPPDGSQMTRQKSIIKRFLSRSSTKRKCAERLPSAGREDAPIRRVVSTNSNTSDDFMDDDDFSTDNSVSDGLVSDEEREYGTIPKRVYLEYFKSCGILAGSLYLVSSVAWQGLRVYTDVWLSNWTAKGSEVEDQSSGIKDMTRYFSVYSILSVVSIATSFASNAIGQYAGALARETLHAKLLETIILCPISFFESTPLGRIINRFSTDIGIIDKKIATSIQRLLQFLFLCLSATLMNAVVTPWFLIIAIPICILYYIIQKFYRCSARELQRLDAITKSPVFSHFGETLGGLPSIRAYGQQERFTRLLWTKMDVNTNAFIILNSSNRWLGIALDYLGGVIVFAAINAALISSKMYPETVTPSLVGLAINYTLLVPIYLNWVVKFLSDMEMYMSAVERVQQYSSLPMEDYGAIGERLPENWPSRGEVKFSGVTLRYGNSKDPVINKLDLHIPAGQRVAICGRTGSGKSSLLLSILRMVETIEGSITVDGLDLSGVPLRSLRTRVAAVPQEGALFGGPLRENLLPATLEDTSSEGRRLGDSELWGALELAQLKQTIAAFPGGLDGVVAEGGAGWSAGERQRLCVARALLRTGALVLLDEPTAALDPATEAALLPALSRGGRTTITVAHRLSTILDYDRVIVMEEGRIMEDGSPKELLSRPMSIFSSMLRAAEE